MGLSQRDVGWGAFAVVFLPKGNRDGFPDSIEQPLDALEESQDISRVTNLPDGWSLIPMSDGQTWWFEDSLPESVGSANLYSSFSAKHAQGEVYVVPAGPAEVEARFYQAVGTSAEVLDIFIRDFQLDTGGATPVQDAQVEFWT